MATARLSKWINTFCGIYWANILGTLIWLLVHPTSPVLLTKNGPLKAIVILIWITIKLIQIPYPFKVWELVKDVSPPIPLIIRFTWYNYTFASAILRETSEETSYSTVRWVFRPYSHIWWAICTSASLRTSIRISPDFIRHSHRSRSFGYQHIYFIEYSKEYTPHQY